LVGSTKEHDLRLTATLQRLQTTGVTLNPNKCEFGTDHIKFLGHIIDKPGVSADPAETCAILQMEASNKISELRRFLGIADQLGKFSPRLAEISQPLRELLSPKQSWVWGPDQQSAFTKIKSELSQPTVLTLYNPKAATKVSTDALSYSLGAVLLQQNGSQW